MSDQDLSNSFEKLPSNDYLSTKKNNVYTPAPTQVTAESILQGFKNSNQKKTSIDEEELYRKAEDLEEIEEYQLRKRTEFEKHLRKDYQNLKNWFNYANFEFEQHDMPRVRSIFERCLLHNKEVVTVWIKYVNSEVKSENINHARNILERAIKILPFTDKLWYYYIQLEESLQNPRGVRDIFNRWLIYEPKSDIYDFYINFELRDGHQIENFKNIESIFTKYVVIHPESKTWIKWLKFEMKYTKSSINIRNIFETSVETLSKINELDGMEDIFILWIHFEASLEEFERCESLFKFSMSKLRNNEKLLDFYLQFAKQHDIQSLNLILLNKRKQTYLATLKESPFDYDIWWEYISLMKQMIVDKTDLIAIFENCLKHKPNDEQKQGKTLQWRKYIYLWIRYLYFMETQVKDIAKTRELYERLVGSIDHKIFTFSKIWISFATFEIRQNDLAKARKLLGQSLGMNAKMKTFKAYLDIEKKLKEIDRVRKIYESCLIKFPLNVSTWFEYIQLEIDLGDYDRAKAIYEVLVNDNMFVNNYLNIWYKFIDFLTSYLYDYKYARELYQQLLNKNKDNVQIWIKSAMFEVSSPDETQFLKIEKFLKDEKFDDAHGDEEEEDEEMEEEFEVEVTEESRNRSRNVFEEGLKYFRSQSGMLQQRVLLMEVYKQFEEKYGDEESSDKLKKRLPIIIKKSKIGAEDEIDYKFPDDELETKVEVDESKNLMMMKFLQNAQRWKSGETG